MSNMGYCRFENTLGDLHDCYVHLTDDSLSEDEEQARKRLVALCGKIVKEFDELMEC